MDQEAFDKAFTLLNGLLVLEGSLPCWLVVCGGAALNMTGVYRRTTKDVDVVALLGAGGGLVDPAPLPDSLVRAAERVAEELRLPSDWLNNGPSSDDGGLFRMGLPDGLLERLEPPRLYGQKLRVSCVSRIDQIHFKLYAAIDQWGSYHQDDLERLTPTSDEVRQAIRWAMTHDPSDGFRQSAAAFLKKIGYADVASEF